MTDSNTPDEQLPDALIAELRRLDRAPDMITSRVDRIVAEASRAHFAQRRTARQQRFAPWGAVAASALLVLVFAIGGDEEPGSSPVYADIDASGRIDIADVLALARTQEHVSRAELDAFAFRIVALDGDGAG